MSTFSAVLDEAAELPLDEQEQLADTLRRRVAEQRRAEILQIVEQGRQDFAAGKLRPSSVASIIEKIRE